mmetsp:Transcript_26594/g.81737  ORF Transcript_26594/g.81737 Transcript_26594/m.81737 type:complete len:197 (+) Transcript_26594:42-632(+)
MTFTCIPLLVASTDQPAIKAFLVVVLALASKKLYQDNRPFLQESDNTLYEGLQMLTVIISTLIFARVTETVGSKSGDDFISILMVAVIPATACYALFIAFRDVSNERAAVAILRTRFTLFRAAGGDVAHKVVHLSTVAKQGVTSLAASPRRRLHPREEPSMDDDADIGDDRDDTDTARDDDVEGVVPMEEVELHYE